MEAQSLQKAARRKVWVKGPGGQDDPEARNSPLDSLFYLMERLSLLMNKIFYLIKAMSSKDFGFKRNFILHWFLN